MTWAGVNGAAWCGSKPWYSWPFPKAIRIDVSIQHSQVQPCFFVEMFLSHSNLWPFQPDPWKGATAIGLPITVLPFSASLLGVIPINWGVSKCHEAEVLRVNWPSMTILHSLGDLCKLIHHALGCFRGKKHLQIFAFPPVGQVWGAPFNGTMAPSNGKVGWWNCRIPGFQDSLASLTFFWSKICPLWNELVFRSEKKLDGWNAMVSFWDGLSLRANC